MQVVAISVASLAQTRVTVARWCTYFCPPLGHGAAWLNSMMYHAFPQGVGLEANCGSAVNFSERRRKQGSREEQAFDTLAFDNQLGQSPVKTNWFLMKQVVGNLTRGFPSPGNFPEGGSEVLGGHEQCPHLTACRDSGAVCASFVLLK